MFTGIIAQLGEIKAITPQSGGLRLSIEIGTLAHDCNIGDSIAVNGACLTVVQLENTNALFDVSNETIEKTNVHSWAVGTQVNLESALRLGDKLGGHMVSGHVDGLGTLLSRDPDGDCELFTFQLPNNDCIRVVEKGSIAIDGISLTCFNCNGNKFQVAVIPHTLKVTNLGNMSTNDRVHMEQDMIGRWVATLLPETEN